MAGWSKNSCGAAIELEQNSESLVTLDGVATLRHEMVTLISPLKTIASSLEHVESRSMSGCAATVAAGNVQGLYVGV